MLHSCGEKCLMWWIFMGSLFIFVLMSVFTNMLELFCMAHSICPLLRMLIFLGKKKKVLWELSGKVDSHKQANLRHLLWEALESLFTVLQISAAHHNLLGCFLYCLFSAKWENLLCFLGMLLWLSSGTVKGTRRCAVKLGLSVPIRPLWVFVKTTPQKAPSSESVTSS